MQKRDKFTSGAILGIFALIIAGIVGWILNIVMIFHDTEFSGMMVVRVIGVFIPIIGAVLGYI